MRSLWIIGQPETVQKRACGKGRRGVRRWTKVKAAFATSSIVIAIHSLDRVFETGLLGYLPEKRLQTLSAAMCRILSPVRFQRKNRRNCAHFPQVSEQSTQISLHFRLCGGESGIRTHVRVSPKHAFQACAFSHSAISPAPCEAIVLILTVLQNARELQIPLLLYS
jgi:hypothetical protein